MDIADMKTLLRRKTFNLNSIDIEIETTNHISREIQLIKQILD